MTEKHSKLPWVVNHHTEEIEYMDGGKARTPFIQSIEPDGSRRFICTLDSMTLLYIREANAAFIVKACNNFEAVVDVLKEIVALTKYDPANFGPSTDRANAILAKIEAEGK